MAYTLVGNCYIGEGEYALPPPVVGYTALDITTGDLYASNTSATNWNLIGNVNNSYLGLAPVSGYTSTGAIYGAHGLATLDSPNFSTSARKDGIELATVSDLADSVSGVLDGIAPVINKAISSTSAGITVKSNIARATGILRFDDLTPQSIPLPPYPDGTTADESDCIWTISFIAGTWPCGRSDSGGNVCMVLPGQPWGDYTPPAGFPARTFAACLQQADGHFIPTFWQYFIEGIRS